MAQSCQDCTLLCFFFFYLVTSALLKDNESERQVLRQGIRTYLESWEDSRLMSQNSHLIWVWMSGSFMDQRWGRWGNKIKMPLILQISPRRANLRQGMCLSFFLQPTGWTVFYTEALYFNRQRTRILWGRLLCINVLIITKAAKKGGMV